MSQFPALAANQMRARRLPYSIITVPRPGWMFHSARLRSTTLNLSWMIFSASAAGIPGIAVSVGGGSVAVGGGCVAVGGGLVGGAFVGGTAVGDGVGDAHCANANATTIKKGISTCFLVIASSPHLYLFYSTFRIKRR